MFPAAEGGAATGTVRIPFLLPAGLVTLLGGPLAAQDITVRNASESIWTLVWCGPDGNLDEKDFKVIELGETSTIEFETPGEHRARI